ncbi:MAG: group II intron maturase-specific domain-containing protein, partial [bacterium]|nr:group II intron maturase-specific domain-containing protein [bacterium]
YSTRTGKAYIGTRPSKKRIARVCRAIHEITSRRWLLLDAHDRVVRLNRLMMGWANYFCLGPVSKAYRAVDAYARYRLRQWLCRKHQHRYKGITRFPDEYLDHTLGLVRLTSRTHNFPWAKA